MKNMYKKTCSTELQNQLNINLKQNNKWNNKQTTSVK